MAPRSRARSGLRAAPLRLERVEPDPRPVHARAGRIALAAKGAKRPYSQLRAGAAAVPARCTFARPSRGDDAPRSARCAAPNGRAATAMPTGAALFAASTSTSCCCACWRATIRTRRCSTPTRRRCRRWRSRRRAGAQAALRAFELLLLREIGLLPDARHRTTLTLAPLRRRAALRAAARGRRCAEAGDDERGAERRALAGAAGARSDDAAPFARRCAGAARRLQRAASPAARAASLSSAASPRCARAR